MSFNSSQQTAINHGKGPMLVLAGPGSGKTTVITHRILHLTKDLEVNPSNILVITFTKAAAKEMEERYLNLIEAKSNQRVTFGTFHAIFFRILKYAYNYNAGNIISEDNRYQIIREIIMKNHIEVNDEAEYIGNVLDEISLVKNEMIPLEQYYSVNFSESEFKDFYNTYEKALQAKRLIDFDDMMVYCYELFSKRPDILAMWQKKYKYILIDEFQDINKLQYQIIRMIAKPEDNIFIVGDDDQSIYRFRGAKPGIMLNFPNDYPAAKQIILDINYRSTPEIISASQKLISHNNERFIKNIKANKTSGAAISFHEFDSIYEQNTRIIEILDAAVKKGESLKDYAIITRTNQQPGYLIQKLMEYNVPFVSRDAIPNIYDHWIAKDIFAYIDIAHGSRKRNDYLRIINRPNRYVSRQVFENNEVIFEDLYKYYEDKAYMCKRLDEFRDSLGMINVLSPYSALNFIFKGIGYEEYLKEYSEYRRMNVEELIDIYQEIMQCAKSYKTIDDWYQYIEKYKQSLLEKKAQYANISSVTITTMHASKGLEFKNVIIPDVNEEITPHKKAVLDADIEEERRMFYVAMTRAKDNLYLFSCKDRFNKNLEKSRFIDEVLGE